MNKTIIYLMLILFLVSFAYAVPEPVAYYEFTDDATDTQGNIGDATYTNQDGYSTDYPNYAVSGDGSTKSREQTEDGNINNVVIPAIWDDLTTGNCSLTISGWFNFDSFAGDYDRIMGDDSEFYLWVKSSGTIMAVDFRNSGSGHQGEGEDVDISDLDTNKWYMITMTHNTTHLALYINDTFSYSWSTDGTCANKGSAEEIDMMGYSASFDMDGTGDSFAFYDYALTTEQIQEIYEYGGYGQQGSGTPIASFISPSPTTPYINNTLGQNYTAQCTENGEPLIYAGNTNPPITLVADMTGTGVNVTHWIVNSSIFTTDDTYYLQANCSNATHIGSSVRSYTYDTTAPTITLNPSSSINATATYDIYSNTLFINTTIDGGTSLIDTFELLVRDYDNGTLRHNTTNSSVDVYSDNFEISIDTTGWASKLYNVSISASDTHTNKEICPYNDNNCYKPKKKLSELEFETIEGINVRIVSKDSAITNYDKLKDRYTFDFEFTDGNNKKRTFDLYSNKPLEYLGDKSNYIGHFITTNGLKGNWIDFEAIGLSKADVIVKKITDYHYEVTIDKLKNKVKFNSIGGLNVNQVQYTYNKSAFSISSVSMLPTTAVTTSDVLSYCTATEEQGIDLTIDWRIYINETSIYNSGTNNSLSSGIEYLLNTIPTTETIPDSNFTLSCRATTTAANNYTNWVNATVVKIVNFIVDNCSQANTIALNFTIFNENDLTFLNSDIVGTLNYTLQGVGNTYTYDLTNEYTFRTCIYPDNFNYTLYAYFQYEETNGNGKLERYYIENATINNVTQQVYMYNFNDTTDLSELNAISYTYYYSPYIDIIGKLQRFYPGENLWRTVQIDKTDEDGQLLFWVYQNTHDYKLLWEDAGGSLDATSPLKFICDSSTECEVAFTLQDPSSADNYAGMDYSYSYNNATGIVSFSWTDSNNLVTSVNLLVQQIASNGFVDICDTTTASSSGTIICNVSDYSGNIQVRAIRTASPADPFFNTIIEKVTGKINEILNTNGLQDEGMALSFLITLAGVGFGASTGSIIVVVIVGLFSLIINFFIGLTSVITYSVLLGIIAVGAIVAYMTRK